MSELDKYFDRKVQNAVMGIMERAAFSVASEITTSTAFGTNQINTEALTPEKLLKITHEMNEMMKANKEDTIRMLGWLGFVVTVNEYSSISGQKPIVMLPQEYKEAMENVKEKEQQK